MKKQRTKTVTEDYEVCDLCGEEVSTVNGNGVHDGETDTVRNKRGNDAYYVHRYVYDGKQSCVDKLIVETIEARRKKK